MGPMQKEDTNTYWEEQTFKQKTLEDIRNTNKSLYQFDMSEMEYKPFADHFLDVMKNEGVEAAEKEKWRYMNALQYSRMYGYDFDYALENVDALNAANMNRPSVQPPDEDYRGICERIGDSFVMGMNSLKRTELGKQLQELEEYKSYLRNSGNQVEKGKWLKKSDIPEVLFQGDIDKQIQDCLEAIMAIDNENQLLSISQKQNIAMDAFTSAAQSLPYTVGTVVKGAMNAGITSSNPLGLAAGSLKASYDSMFGNNYIDLRQKGISPKIASKVSNIESGIQGVIEVALDQTIGAVLNVAGKGNVTNIVSDAINKATGG
ncbi:MAG: hypothetical protein MJ052_01475, partial [Sphaerochaetaceae bacterium]|nr:hypothetical protein [Sphaerochaetaceae bacterium]